jgi:hypothetical protein
MSHKKNCNEKYNRDTNESKPFCWLYKNFNLLAWKPRNLISMEHHSAVENPLNTGGS